MVKSARSSGLPDEIVFAVCQKFLVEGFGATRIQKWLKSEKNVSVTREQIYPLLREAVKHGWLVLHAPRDVTAAQRMAGQYRQPVESVRVVDVRGPSALEHVAVAAADMAVSIVKDLGSRKARVHIGLGAGWTTMSVARHVAHRLRSEQGVPKLTLHALSSGFSVRHPRTAPVSFFSFFHDAGIEIDYVGLFAPAVVDAQEYDRVKQLPGVRESFEVAGEIDLVITSLASAEDGDGELTQFISIGPGTAERDRLRQAGWVGDVQYRPYSASGPIMIDAGPRAVTLFELPELVRLAGEKDKHVILVAGPCGRCERTRSDALQPLLKEPSLKVWSRVVMDIGTAEELLPA